jgi:hypothetical protein
LGHVVVAVYVAVIARVWRSERPLRSDVEVPVEGAGGVQRARQEGVVGAGVSGAVQLAQGAELQP